VAAAIAVERTEQPLGPNHLGHAAEAAAGTFFGHQKHRVMLVGGVVHGHDQVPPLTGHPFVPATVLVQHHPRQRHPFALAPVRPLRLTLGYQPCFLQVLLDPAVAALAPIAPVPTVKVPHVPAEVSRVVALRHGQHLVHRRPSLRHQLQPPVDQPVQPLRLIAHHVPPETTLAHPQQMGCLRLGQPPHVPPLVRLLESHLPDLL